MKYEWMNVAGVILVGVGLTVWIIGGFKKIETDTPREPFATEDFIDTQPGGIERIYYLQNSYGDVVAAFFVGDSRYTPANGDGYKVSAGVEIRIKLNEENMTFEVITE